MCPGVICLAQVSDTLYSLWWIKFDPRISLGDIAETLAIPAAVFVAILTLRWTSRDDRELAFLRDALTQLSLLADLGTQIAAEVEMNLRQPQKDHKVHQVKTDLMRRRLDAEVKIAQIFLSEPDAKDLELAHKAWYDGTFCEDWPRSTRTGPLRPGDNQLAELTKARNQWGIYLMKLKRAQVNRIHT